MVFLYSKYCKYEVSHGFNIHLLYFFLQPLQDSLAPSSPQITSSPPFTPSLLSSVWIILQLIIFHISIPPSAHTDLSVKLSCVILSCHSSLEIRIRGSDGLFTEMRLEVSRWISPPHPPPSSPSFTLRPSCFAPSNLHRCGCWVAVLVPGGMWLMTILECHP